jgi:hypothetical protein
MRKPFGVITLIDKSYAVPGWFPVPLGTQYEDLANMEFDIEEEPEIKYKPQPKIEKLVKSSSGIGEYTVKFNGMYWSCTCKGYGFRRYCRHIEEVKQSLEQKTAKI